MGKRTKAGALALGLMVMGTTLAGEPRAASACSCGCEDEKVPVELESVEVEGVGQTNVAAYEGSATVGLGFDGEVYFGASKGEGALSESQSYIKFSRR